MKISFYPRFFTAGLLVLVVSAFAQSPADPAGDALGKAVELTPLTITGARDLPPPEAWHHAEIEGFEVLSNASENATNRLLKDFQKFRQALQIVWPVPAQTGVSSSLVLCGRKDKFSDFAPNGKADANTGLVSLFLRDREQTAIVIDLEPTNFSPTDLATQMPGTAGNVEMVVDPYRQLYREYVRFLLSRTDAPPPPWLIEGLSQIIMDIEFTDRWIIAGKIDGKKGAPSGGDMSTGEDGSVSVSDAVVGDQPFNAALLHRKLLPMDRFFAVPADAPEVRNPLGNNLWAKQAYAFVHLCLCGADPKFQQPFAQFLKRLRAEPPSEKLFQECFKISYKEMLDKLYAYISYTNHKYRTYELPKNNRLIAADVVMRDATQGEIGRIKGDAQRLAGRRDDALATYRTAYARGERDALLLGALGTEEQHAGQSDRARKQLDAAFKAGATRPSAHVAFARLRLAEAKAKPAAPDGKLSAKQMADVLEPLFQALALPPALPETYELIAEAWTLSAVRPTLENVQVLGDGVVKFPRNSTLTYEAAQLFIRAGDTENATAIVQLGIRFAPDAATRSRFEALLATMPAPKPVSR